MVERGRPRYCLRGQVNGRERRFLLQPGVNQIGSLPAGDIVLPVKGISRRHAVIAVDAEGVKLRDLGSKNGTFHNGIRTGEARLSAGDVIRLGGVQLTLEQMSAREGEIAIHLRPPLGPRAEALGEETSLLEREGRELLSVVERLAEQLAPTQSARSPGSPRSPRAAEIAAALRILAAACGADGAIAGAWDGEREPVVLATHGDVGAWSAVATDLLALLPAARGEHAAAAAYRTERRLLDQLYVCGGLPRPGQDMLYLAVWGGGDEGGYAAGLIHVFLRLLDRSELSRRGPDPAATPAPGPDLVPPAGYVRGSSRAMEAVYSALAELARTDLSVVFQGETGVGKECLVRMLHASSPRAGSPFVAINCAAIPADLLEAELFGIRKGVATGVDERKGRFQQAGGGTLLLDEIADLPPSLQAKLLRVLQEREVQPVGGPAYPLAARIVAASNRSLEHEAAQGRFRADLYYRLAGYVLHVPPLRQRREDIPLLVESLAQRAAEESAKWIRGITFQALEALVAYPWPGNVRQLDNEVRRLVQRCPHGSAIDSSMLSEALGRAGAAALAAAGAGAGGAAGGAGAAGADDPGAATVAEDGAGPLGLQPAIERLERRLIGRALERTAGNRSQAARLLGISRNGLAEKMERLGIALQLVPGREDGEGGEGP
jgi:DNA-binding NtrC family response regulator